MVQVEESVVGAFELNSWVRPVGLFAGDIYISTYCFWVEIVFGEIDIATEGLSAVTYTPLIVSTFSLTLLTVPEVLIQLCFD